MIVRKASRPPFGEFWGCSQYPSCRETKPMNAEPTDPPADPELSLLQDRVKEALKSADKLGLLRKHKGVAGYLCKVLKLQMKDNQHFLWKLSEEQCHMVLRSLGEE